MAKAILLYYVDLHTDEYDDYDDDDGGVDDDEDNGHDKDDADVFK